MPDYEKLYHYLFNGITDIIEELKDLQINAEEIYLESCEEEDRSNVLKLINTLSSQE